MTPGPQDEILMEQRDYSLSTTARLPRLFILYVYVFGYIGQLIDQSQGC